jgi:hypothetical protein
MTAEAAMKKVERLRYEMLLRVRDFGVKHRQRFPDGSMGGKAFRVVGASVAQIDAHNTARVLNGRGARQARRVARETLVEQLTAVARTARAVSKSVAVSDAMVPAPGRLPDIALLATARAILEESEESVDYLVLLGLPETLVTDLQELIDRFEQALNGCRSNRAGVAAAVHGIRTAFAQALDACRTLDVVVTNTQKKDPVLLAVWKRDRRVNPGSRVAAAAAPAVGVTVVPIGADRKAS